MLCSVTFYNQNKINGRPHTVCGQQTLETALGYWLDNQKVWVLFLADAPMFHFATTFILGLGLLPVSYKMDNQGSVHTCTAHGI